MQIRSVLTMLILMLGLLAFSVVGSPTSAQDLPDPPGDPEAKTCVIPAALGASPWFSCTTDTHQYSELIEHGFTGSVFVGEPGATPYVLSQLLVTDENGDWTVAHQIKCDSVPTTVTKAADPDACEETGEPPSPGTVVRHRCATTRTVAGAIVCSIVYLR